MNKILFVDDDPGMRETVRDILAEKGYEIVVAQDGNETIKLAKDSKPDLIVLDYLLPDINGSEVCKILKKNPETEHIPVIIVTAYPDQKEESLRAGAIDFVTKPIDNTDLLLRISSVFKVKHIKNELQKIIAYISELEKPH